MRPVQARISIDAMAHNLRLKVVAEGVETQEQASRLMAEGFEEVQGYLFGKPMPCDQLLNWLAERGQATA